MCRAIQRLFNVEPPAEPEEIQAAARQYVRKIAGSTTPSRRNAEAFELAVAEVAAASARLLAQLVPAAPPQDRVAAAARRRARAAAR